MVGETALTREQLLLAFRHLARPGWPATLEEAMEDPARRGCIHGMARCLSRAKFNAVARAVPTPPGAPPVPPTPTEPPARRRFDAKRAAANDLDD